MISYRIISNNGSLNSNRKVNTQLDPRDPNFKEQVFQKSLQTCIFREGDRVKVRGTPLRGKITEIIKGIKDVKWDRNRPQYIEVELDNGELRVANPGQLKRISK